MALTTEQKQGISRRYADAVFVTRRRSAAIDRSHIEAGADVIDAVLSSLPVRLNPAKTVLQNILDALPAEFSRLGTSEKVRLISETLNEQFVDS